MFLFLLICSLLVPAVMLIGGHVMLRHPPKEINWAYGYRTRRSMRSRETWDFAHAYCGRLWRTLGGVLLGVSAVTMLALCRADEKTVSVAMLLLMIVQLLALVASIFPTERALKRRFPDTESQK